MAAVHKAFNDTVHQAVTASARTSQGAGEARRCQQGRAVEHDPEKWHGFRKDHAQKEGGAR